MPASKRTTRRSRASAVADQEEVLVQNEEDAAMSDIKEETDKQPDSSQVEDTPMKDEETSSSASGSEKSPKKDWTHRITEGLIKKVPKDVQKRRRNFRLKRMIIPKNPVMILNELLGKTIQFDVADPLQHGPNFYFMARTVYEGQEFIGNGPSKTIAKNIAAEHLLQYITTQTCVKQEAETGDQEKPQTFETETPWTALASLAMFKLFNDWQAQGYTLPSELVKNSACTNWQQQQDKFPGLAPEDTVSEKKQKPKKEKVEKVRVDKSLPENPLMRHPVQLLNEMKGQLDYEETGREGVPPNCIFTITVQIGEEKFSGQGKTKKDAKKGAAEAALSKFYDLKYQ